MEMIPHLLETFGSMKSKAGYAALAVFLLETTILALAIKSRRLIQERCNKKRIEIALTNYSLK